MGAARGSETTCLPTWPGSWCAGTCPGDKPHTDQCTNVSAIACPQPLRWVLTAPPVAPLRPRSFITRIMTITLHQRVSTPHDCGRLGKLVRYDSECFTDLPDVGRVWMAWGDGLTLIFVMLYWIVLSTTSLPSG